MIASVVESGEAYAIRRICNAAAKLRRQKQRPERRQLIRAASVTTRFEMLPAFQATLDYELVRGRYKIAVEDVVSRGLIPTHHTPSNLFLARGTCTVPLLAINDLQQRPVSNFIV